MTKPTYSKTESTTTKFEITMPSGNLFKISLYPETAKKDVEFVERLVKLACATEPDINHQDKSALFKSLGLVPWDNKPPACTDTVWIEPGKVATKESQGSKP